MRGLVVTQDAPRARFLLRVLQEEGFIGELCSDGETALAWAEKTAYAIILVCWIRAEWDGLAVCRMLRAAGIDRPLLIILPSGGPEEYRAVLDAGADDYLAEPFALNELSRRIHGLVGGSTGTMHIKVGPLSIDPVKHTVRLGGAPLYLTSRKYALLLHLAYNADRPVSREELLDQLCQSEGGPAIRSVRPAAIAVMMSRLREELGEFRWIIGTVRGAGYVLRAVPGK